MDQETYNQRLSRLLDQYDGWLGVDNRKARWYQNQMNYLADQHPELEANWDYVL